jgi:uncharacterized protein
VGVRSSSSVVEVEIELGGHPGLVVRPRGARALYVLAHGAGAGMRHAFLVDLAAALADRAIATARWELPYMAAGRKRPDPPAIAEAAVRDVWRAAARRYPRLARFAGGKSFGGRMTSRAHAAAPLPGRRGLVFLGFPLHPPDKPGPAREVAARRREAAAERAAHLSRAAGPMLFLQGTRDALADLALLRPVVAGLGPRATLELVGGADHGFDVLVRSGTSRERGRDGTAPPFGGAAGRAQVPTVEGLAASISAWIARVLDS